VPGGSTRGQAPRVERSGTPCRTLRHCESPLRAEAGHKWTALIRDSVTKSDLDADPDQLAFELIAFPEAANVQAVLHDAPSAYDLARNAVRSRLTPSRPLPR
jgi:hypothetical protein